MVANDLKLVMVLSFVSFSIGNEVFQLSELKTYAKLCKQFAANTKNEETQRKWYAW